MRACALLLLSCLAAACGVVPERPVPDDPVAEWRHRQRQLQALDYWNMTGRVAVQAGEEGGQGRLRWIQDQRFYDITLTSPFGRSVVHLEGNEAGVTLRQPQGEVIVAERADLLLAEHLGWAVPVDQLRYWLVGLSGTAADFDLDRYGRLKRLKHNGWAVDFVEYRSVEGAELPKVIQASSADLRIRLAVDNWRLERTMSRPRSRVLIWPETQTAPQANPQGNTF